MKKTAFLKSMFALLISLAMSAAAAAEESVALTIDFNDGEAEPKEFANLAWAEGMSVADAMQAAGKIPKGPKFVHRGQGKTAFLQEIDGVRNQGGGGRNWVYRVNGKLGDRSFALKNLSAGDVVLWRFQKFE